MIPSTKIKEIRDHLNSAENPLIIFDGDSDGMSSFLLFRRYMGKGYYIVQRNSPEVDVEYLKVVRRVKPDRIFVLDKPMISQEFIDNVKVPIIWLDHHLPVKRQGVNYYNPRLNNIHDERCTSYWAYKVTNGDIWIAMMGIIADSGLDEFKTFRKKYPDLVDGNIKTAYQALYQTKFGDLIKKISFILKGKQNFVNKNIDLMIDIKTPYELINETSKNAKKLMKYAKSKKKIYDKLLKKGLKDKKKSKLFYFEYENDVVSFTGELSNEFMFLMPKRFIIVARKKEDVYIMSLRSNNHFIPKMLEKAFRGLDGRGGGHDHACGAAVNAEHFKIFLDRMKKLI